MKRRLIRRATALVVFAMAVVIGSGHALLRYRCVYDRVSRTSCCCPASAAKARGQLPDVPVIKASCCCSVEAAKVAATAATTNPASDAAVAIRPVAIVAIVEVRAAVRVDLVMDREARPPPRLASLFEQRSSFLV